MTVNPCRYCGRGPEDPLGPAYKAIDWQVVCDCGCSGPFADSPRTTGTQDQAVARWNSINPPKEESE